MRLNIPLCVSFLGALVSFSSVSARATYGHHYQLAERDASADLISMRDQGLLDLRDDGFLDIRDEDHLDMRDGGLLDIRDVEDLYEMLVRRAKISAAAAAARKATQKAAANKHGKAPHALTAKPKGAKQRLGGQPKHPKQVAADARAHARKEAHAPITNIPGGHQRFQVPNGGPSFTGKDVRKAVWAAHQEHARLTGPPAASKTQLKKSPLKNFGNSNHRQPHASNPHDVKSLNHMSGTGHEYPLGPLNPKGPARVITSQLPGGRTKFEGVVAHDVTRTAADLGHNDHFQVHPTR